MRVRAFAICLDDPSQAQSEALTRALRNLGVSWWHHLHGLWLIADTEESRDSGWWWGFAGQIVPEIGLLVFEIKEGARWVARLHGEAAMSWLEKVFNGERFPYPPSTALTKGHQS